MPVMNGLDLCERLYNDPQLKGVEVIILSGSLNDKDRELAMKLGCKKCLRKPDYFSTEFFESFNNDIEQVLQGV